MSRVYTADEIDARMSDDNLARVSRILCEDMDIASRNTHKIALIESAIVSVDANGYGVSLKVLDIKTDAERDHETMMREMADFGGW